MPHLLAASAAALIIWIIYQVVVYVKASNERVRKEAELGCGRAPLYPADPFGLQFVVEYMKADAAQRMPAFQIERLEYMSSRLGRVVHTYEVAVPPALAAWVTYEPENIKAILATQFEDFALPIYRCKGFGPLLGSGIFSSNGKQWEHSRALLRPHFARRQMTEAATNDRHSQNLVQAIGTPDETGWTALIDLMPLLSRFSMDLATDFLFGQSTDSLLDASKSSLGDDFEHRRSLDFAEDWECAQDYLTKVTRLGELYLLAHYSGGLDFFRRCRRVHQYIDRYVQLALEIRKRESVQSKSDYRSEPESEPNKPRVTFLQALAQDTQDPQELRSQICSILIAGRDTTASLLGWVFRELALHPDVFEKLRAIIIEQFGDFNQPRDITFENLRDCRYLCWVLNETLRVYPVVSINAREAVRDTTLPTGGGPDGTQPIFIPKGCEIVYSVHVVHHRKDLWGPDADEWKPERWEYRRPPGWEFLPFNGGPRICIGQQFALTEAAYVIVRLLQKFDKIDGSKLVKENPKHGLRITNSPGDGVWVRFRVART